MEAYGLSVRLGMLEKMEHPLRQFVLTKLRLEQTLSDLLAHRATFSDHVVGSKEIATTRPGAHLDLASSQLFP